VILTGNWLPVREIIHPAAFFESPLPVTSGTNRAVASIARRAGRRFGARAHPRAGWAVGCDRCDTLRRLIASGPGDECAVNVRLSDSERDRPHYPHRDAVDDLAVRGATRSSMFSPGDTFRLTARPPLTIVANRPVCLPCRSAVVGEG